jgi:hypothetical protein
MPLITSDNKGVSRKYDLNTTAIDNPENMKIKPPKIQKTD